MAEINFGIPELAVWNDGVKYTIYQDGGGTSGELDLTNGLGIVYEKSVAIGTKLSEWGTPAQAQVYTLAHAYANSPREVIQAVWEAGRRIGVAEGYGKAQADMRKAMGIK